MKRELFTEQFGVREVCNWQTLEPQMLGKINLIIDSVILKS